MTADGLRSNRRRHGDRFTVVVVPSGAGGDTLMQGVSVWNTAGLIAPAAWVRPEDVLIENDRPPGVVCHFVGPWGDEELSLFDVLGQYRRDLVRVIACQVFDTAATVDSAQVDAALKVLEAVRYSVPAIVTDNAVGVFGTTVLGANVVTGSTGLSGVPRGVIKPAWDINVVTSPEDRRDPSRANTFVRPGANLFPVALTSVAAVGGLFAGVPEGPFDHLTGDAATTSGKTMVIRTTVRAILGERAVQDVARLAVSQAPAAGGPSRFEQDAFTTAIGSGLVDDTVDWVETVDAGALARSRPEAAADSPTRYVQIKQGVAAFFRFYGQALLAVPLALWDIALRRAESLATQALVGGTEHSGIAVTLRADASRDLGQVLLGWEAEDIGRNQATIRDAGRRPVRPPTAELWRSLRLVSEGLLDGSELPAGSPVQMDGTRRVLLSTASEIAPRPDDVFQLDTLAISLVGLSARSQGVIAACDPVGATAIGSGLAGTASDKRSELLAATAKAKALEGRTSDPDDGVDDDARPELAAPEKEIDALKIEIAVLDGESDRLSDWVRSRDASLLWRITDRVNRRASDAEKEADEAAELATAASGLDELEPVKMRARYLKTVFVWLVVLAVAAFWLLRWGPGSAGSLRSWLPWMQTGYLWGFWVIVLVGVTTLLIRRWYVGTLHFLLRFKRAWDLRSAALNQFLAATSDRGRLQAATQQLSSWAEVLGWTTHTPWSTTAPTADPESALPDASWLPESLRLAEPQLDEVTRSAATDLAIRHLTRRGWRRRAYGRIVSAGLALKDDTSRNRAIEAIDTDPTAQSGIRAQLQKSLSEGVPQRKVVDDVIEEAAGLLRDQRLGAANLRVHLDRIDPDEQQNLSDIDFLAQALVIASPLSTETWTDPARVVGDHAKPKVLAWATPEVCTRAANGVDARPLDIAETERRALVDVAVRVDMAGWVDLDALRLFAPRERLTETVPEPDEGVFT